MMGGVRCALGGANMTTKWWLEAHKYGVQHAMRMFPKLKEKMQRRRALGSHWLFDVKYKADGTVDRFEVRLVVQGNTQLYGIDYREVFAPVARYESLRLLLALATIQGLYLHQKDVSIAFLNGVLNERLYLHQKDVSTAFLNGVLNESIYMRQPLGFRSENRTLVCKLQKSLYGLKQAPRIWYEVVSAFLKVLGFVRCKKEHCLYIKRWEVNGVKHLPFVCVYVDDLTIAGSHLGSINDLKAKLSEKFTMKDLGELHYLLKMEIKRNLEKKTLRLSQQKKNKMKDCTIAPTPQAKSVDLEKEANITPDKIAAQPFDYRGLVGSLMYLVSGTRPDIANTVRDLSKYLSCYNKTHFRAAQRVLKYLKGTSKSGKDVNTAESELVATSEGVREAMWLRLLLKWLGYGQWLPTHCWCYNTAAISIIKDPCSHSSTKHIGIRHLYVRDKHEAKCISVTYCSTNDMIADALTKPLTQGQFEKLRLMMGVKDLEL
ncbi:Gag-pol Polyprotein [Phytophthora megakarya]|uniref:Gag-pol Polyprotein n=1 Tax=Phytophthora megakarya TaxID=4795 RepID=A0A225VSA1_9STRA|nr:Gag-pol Polyprotein [Phytophthora megakarya]